MLAQHPSHGEHTAAALLTGPRRLADLGDRAGTGLHGGGNVTVADHGAVAEDHSWTPGV